MAYVNLLEIVYPVGSLYFSELSTPPSEIIGGQWAVVGGCIRGAESTGSVGSDYHTITIKEMPNHAHYVKAKRGVTNYDDIEGLINWPQQLVGNIDHSDVFGDKATDYTGGGNQCQSCPTHTIVTFGSAQLNRRGDVECPTSTYLKSCIPLEASSFQRLQQALLHMLEAHGFKSQMEDLCGHRVRGTKQVEKTHTSFYLAKCPIIIMMFANNLMTEAGIHYISGAPMLDLVTDGKCQPWVKALRQRMLQLVDAVAILRTITYQNIELVIAFIVPLNISSIIDGGEY